MKNLEKLREALVLTAKKITEGESNYQWGHMGRCNVGQLVQTLTGMDSKQILESVSYSLDEWSEHANSYCDNTGHDVEEIFRRLGKYGLSVEDIMKLEYLSDTRILDNLKGGFRYLRRNEKEDVALYMKSMAELI